MERVARVYNLPQDLSKCNTIETMLARSMINNEIWERCLTLKERHSYLLDGEDKLKPEGCPWTEDHEKLLQKAKSDIEAAEALKLKHTEEYKEAQRGFKLLYTEVERNARALKQEEEEAAALEEQLSKKKADIEAKKRKHEDSMKQMDRAKRKLSAGDIDNMEAVVRKAKKTG